MEKSFDKIPFLKYQHSIAEAEKSVFVLNCGLICVHGVVVAHKCGNKHYKGAFGQMEVCDKSVDDLEFVAGVNENIGVALVLVHILKECAHTFKSTAGGGSHGNYTAALSLGLFDKLRRFLWQMIMLGVHLVFEHLVLLYGTECAKSYMKCDECGVYSPGTQVVKHFICKVQSCGGSCGRAKLVGIYCLIALLILQLLVM